MITASMCVLALCASTPATASEATKLTFTGANQAHAGASARFQATFSAPVPSCDMYADATLIERVVPRTKVLVLTLRLPRSARAQVLRLRLSCGAEQAKTVLHVLGPAHGSAITSLRLSVRQEGAALRPSALPSAAGAGEEAPASCTDAYTCPPRNFPSLPAAQEAMPLSMGACTDWAGYKRPDIWYEQAANDPLTSWAAWTWVEHARAEGLTVSSTPQAGAVAVWQPGMGGAGTDGHVAYVESIEGGQVTISEMNAPEDPTTMQTPEGYTYYERTLSEAELSSQGAQFIAPPS